MIGIFKILLDRIKKSLYPLREARLRHTCTLCGRRIEEGMIPPEQIKEWYSERKWEGWFQGEQLLLKCSVCGRVYCSDCAPRFWHILDDPIFAPRECECGHRKLVWIPGRQQGSRY